MVGQHLLYGSLLVIGGYLVVTWALLVVQGQKAALATYNPVALLVGTGDLVLGKAAGNLIALGLMVFFIMVCVIENVVAARMLLAASVDQRLPLRLSRLNVHRVPAPAIWFQTLCASGYTAILFFVVPLLTFLGDPANVTNEFYFVTAASLLLIWVTSFLFLFVDVFFLLRTNRAEIRSRLLVPLPLLLGSSVSGGVVCLATIVDTLLFSFLPGLMSNTLWGWVVGSTTIILLVLCALGSMYATSQASWEEWAAGGP